MKTTIEMAREAAGNDWGLFQEYMPEIHRLVELVRADERRAMMQMEAMERQVNILTDALAKAKAEEREHIAQMIENAPALVEYVTNDHGGCLMCGFTPKLASAAIRNRSNT